MEQDSSQINVLGPHLRVIAHPGSLWGDSWDPEEAHVAPGALGFLPMAGGSVALFP